MKSSDDSCLVALARAHYQGRIDEQDMSPRKERGRTIPGLRADALAHLVKNKLMVQTGRAYVITAKGEAAINV